MDTFSTTRKVFDRAETFAVVFVRGIRRKYTVWLNNLFQKCSVETACMIQTLEALVIRLVGN